MESGKPELHCVVYWNIKSAPSKKYNPSEDCNHYGITDVCSSDLLLPRAGCSVDTAASRWSVYSIVTIVWGVLSIFAAASILNSHTTYSHSQPRGATAHTFASKWNKTHLLWLWNLQMLSSFTFDFPGSLLLEDKRGECREACVGLIDDGWCPVSSPRKLIREQQQRMQPISRTVCHHQVSSGSPLAILLTVRLLTDAPFTLERCNLSTHVTNWWIIGQKLTCKICK